MEQWRTNRDLPALPPSMVIHIMVIRGIRAHGDSGWGKVWRKPLSHGSSNRRSPDLRKESGLCVFDSRNPSALGRCISQSICLLINNSDAVELSRIDAGCLKNRRMPFDSAGRHQIHRAVAERLKAPVCKTEGNGPRRFESVLHVQFQWCS